MSVLKLVGKEGEVMGGVLELYPINGRYCENSCYESNVFVLKWP